MIVRSATESLFRDARDDDPRQTSAGRTRGAYTLDTSLPSRAFYPEIMLLCLFSCLVRNSYRLARLGALRPQRNFRCIRHALGATLLVLTSAAVDAQILDQTFEPNPNNTVLALALQPDGKLLVGGSFTNIARTARSNLARLNPNGTLDTSFLPVISGSVYAITLQPDGKVLIGGIFSAAGGIPRGRLARLNANGTLDAGFVAEVGTGVVRKIIVQPDERIVIGGSFNTVGGQARSGLARLNRDGTLDEAFSADIAGFPPPGATTVLDLALEADGGILVGGQFATLKGALRQGLGRIRRDGTLDEIFNVPVVAGTSPVIALEVQRDGKILVGGSNFYLGSSRRSFARLNRDGTLDLTFQPIVLGAVMSIAGQADGRVLIGGRFTSVDNTERTSLARLLPSAALDGTFPFDAINTSASTALPVEVILPTTDGRIFIGGGMTIVGGLARNGLARFVPPTLQVVGHPVTAGVVPGGVATFSVTVTGASPAYQWRKNGNPIPGATNATFSIAAVQAGDAGAYDVVASNSLGSVTSQPATLTLISTARLTNASVRTTLGSGQFLIVGFVVSRGSTDVLVRAAGPALAQFGLMTAMADPRMELYRDSTKLLENDNWPAALAGTFTRVGAFPFESNSRDAALVQSLTGNHSVVASGASPGVVLVETYDAGVGQSGRLINISARNQVGRDADILIAGFSVSGVGTMPVLIRAVGPTIGGAPFGVPGVLVDPKLELFDANGSKIGENDNWEPAVAASFASGGAFPLAPGSKDSAMVVFVRGGQNYTAQVKGADGGTGVALVEIFELP